MSNLKFLRMKLSYQTSLCFDSELARKYRYALQITFFWYANFFDQNSPFSFLFIFYFDLAPCPIIPIMGHFTNLGVAVLRPKENVWVVYKHPSSFSSHSGKSWQRNDNFEISALHPSIPGIFSVTNLLSKTNIAWAYFFREKWWFSWKGHFMTILVVGLISPAHIDAQFLQQNCYWHWATRNFLGGRRPKTERKKEKTSLSIIKWRLIWIFVVTFAMICEIKAIFPQENEEDSNFLTGNRFLLVDTQVKRKVAKLRHGLSFSCNLQIFDRPRFSPGGNSTIKSW